VQSTQKSAIIPRNVLDAVPTGRTYAAEGALVPGVKVSESNVGGARSGSQQRLTVHGSVSSDATIEVDGISMNSWGDVQPNHNEGFFQEVTVQTAALGSEVATGGVRVNLIPEGRRQFLQRHRVLCVREPFDAGQQPHAAASALGVTSGDAVKRLWDSSITLGGPIQKDKLWFGRFEMSGTETLSPTRSCRTAALGFPIKRCSTAPRG
jgi:hypothetical protein